MFVDIAGMILALLPRQWLQAALLTQWSKSLPHEERVRLDMFGATGNPTHHPYAWADDIHPRRAEVQDIKPQRRQNG